MLIGLIGVLLAGLATPPGRALLENVIERAASSDGMAIDIEGLSGFPPFTFGVVRVMVADAQGPFVVVDGASANWSPVRLIFGEIALPELTVERVALARQPILPPTPPNEAGGGGVPPIAIGRLAVNRFELATPVIGHAAALAVAASVKLDASGAIQASADLQRIDERLFQATLRVDRPSNGLGTARLEMKEAENGLLVALIGQAAGPAYAFTLDAREAANGAEGTLRLTSGARDRLDGSFQLADAAQGRRLTARLAGELVDLAPKAFADLIAGAISGEVDVAIVSPADVRIASAEVRAGAIALSARGQLGEAGDQFTGRLIVRRGDGQTIRLGAPETGVALDALDLNLAVAPGEGGSRLDVTGSARGLTAGGVGVPGLGISLAAEARGRRLLDPGPLPFAGRFEANRIVSAYGTLDATPGRPLIVRLEGDATPSDSLGPIVSSVGLEAGGGRATFAGAARASGVVGKAALAFADLAVLEAVLGPGFGGALTVTADGTLFSPGPSADLTIDAKGEAVRIGVAALDGLLAGALTASGKVALESNGTAIWRDLAVNTAALAVRSTGEIGRNALDGALTATLTDLGAVAPGGRGAVRLEATARGAPAAPDVQGSLSVKAGEIGGRALEDALVSFTASPGAEGPRGALTLAGRYAGRPLSGGLDVEQRQAGFAAPKIDVAIGLTTIKGAVSQRRDGQLEGRLTIKAPQLAELAALALVEAKGALDAEISLIPGALAADQRADFSVTGRDIGGAGATVANLDATGSVTGLAGTPAINAIVKARRITASGLSIDTVDAVARDDGTATRFDITTTGRDLAGRVTGDLTRRADGFRLEVKDGTVRALGLDTRLSAPLVVTRAGRAMTLDTARLSIGGGTLTASGPLEPSLKVDAALGGLPATFLNRFAPELGASGRIDAKANATGSLADPRINWSVVWAQMALAATKEVGLPPFQINATGSATAKSTTLDAKIAGAGLAFTVAGKAPLGPGALDLKANGRVPMALVGARLGREVRANGNVDLAVTITGSAAKPSINGAATLVGVAVADAATGLGVRGVGGRVRFDGVTATVEGVNGQLQQGGRFTLSGPVSVDAAKGLPANLRLAITDGVYADGNMVRARFGAALALEGPLTGGALASGRVDLGRVEVTLPDRLPSSVANLSITHQNSGKPDPAAKPTVERRPRAAKRVPANRPIRLDIAVEARQGVFVRGFGLDAELGGGVRVRGTVSDPTIEGGFDMRRGRFEVLARRFDFSRGRLTFAGDLMPELDFVASTKTSDATVSVVVNGAAQAPSFSFQSTPSLPAEEVVSRLLFDRGIGKLSTVQAVRLVDELGKLSGVTKGGIFDGLRRSFGLTDLDIKQDEKGNVAVGVGGQITDRLRVGVEQGAQPGSGKVIVDVDVIENLLKGRGEVGANGKGKVGITIEREY